MGIYAWLQRNQFAILGLALVLLAGGIAADVLSRRDPPGLQFAYSSSLPDGSPIRLEIAGAVVHPGVYGLREGDRVVDALAAAGGPSSDADLESLNMARRVRDEERLVVPRKGGGSAVALPPGSRVDINSASQQQLDALPGIGEAYSRRIVDSRRIDGPYKTTRELVDRKVIPSALYDQIRDLVTAGQ